MGAKRERKREAKIEMENEGMCAGSEDRKKTEGMREAKTAIKKGKQIHDK